jgi:predicted small secreted protein
MKIAILVSVLVAMTLGSIGCSRTVKGAERDVHSDAKWVGHRF